MADFTPLSPAEFRDELASLKSITFWVVREVDGTYQPRPSVEDVPNALWIGEADATEESDFVQWNPTTGEGDTWQEFINE